MGSNIKERMLSADVFRKIKEPQERESIFQHLVTAQREVIAKTLEPDSAIILLDPKQIIKDRLYCTPRADKAMLPDGPVILQFFTGDEKYFGQAKGRHELDSYVIDLDFDLYLLQRREDFRLRFPRSISAKFKAAKWQAQPFTDPTIKTQWILLDMSAGGCRMEVPPSGLTLELGQTLEGELEIQNRAAIPIKAEIKHIAPSPEDPLIQFVGLQFIQVSQFSKDRLVAIVMDLYREIFSSLKNRIQG